MLNKGEHPTSDLRFKSIKLSERLFSLLKVFATPREIDSLAILLIAHTLPFAHLLRGPLDHLSPMTRR